MTMFYLWTIFLLTQHIGKTRLETTIAMHIKYEVILLNLLHDRFIPVSILSVTDSSPLPQAYHTLEESIVWWEIM